VIIWKGVIAVEKLVEIKENERWLLCPVCDGKTRVKLWEETELKNFPLFCPKCGKETKVNVKQFNTSVIKEPDA